MTRKTWIFILACLFWLTPSSACWGLSFYWGDHPDKERLVIVFDPSVPKYSIERSAKRALLISQAGPVQAWSKTPSRKDFTKAGLFDNLVMTPEGIRIDLKTDGFSYVHFTLPKEGKLVVDVFEDPLGARWTPVQTRPEPVERPVLKGVGGPGPDDSPDPVVMAGDKDGPGNRTGPEGNRSVAKPANGPVKEEKQPFFSAPNTYRAVIAPPEGELPEPDEPKIKPEKPESPEPEKLGPPEAKIGPEQGDSAKSAGKGEPLETNAAANKSLEMEKIVVEPKGGETAPGKAGPEPGKEAAARKAKPETGVDYTRSGDGYVTGLRARIPAPGEESGDILFGGPPVEGGPGKPTAAPEEGEGLVQAPEARGNQTGPLAAGPGNHSEELIYEPPPGEMEAAGPPSKGEPGAEAEPDFETTLLTAKVSMNNKDYQNAMELLTGLKNHRKLPEEMREDVLYLYAQALYAVNKDKLAENYNEIMSAFRAALNLNPKSANAPAAYLTLGLINLRVNSPRDAKAYFDLLERNFPNDENVPLIYYYWGDYYFKKRRYQLAADNFQYVVQKYPDNKLVLEASVGLADALNKLGHIKQAVEIVDFIEKRWPRYYVEQYPPILRLTGDINFKSGNYDEARLKYWTYYNLDPDAEDADEVLARLGDIYLKAGLKTEAREVYEKTVARFPEKVGGLVAKMRLAEEGIYDEPSISDMFTIFDRPFSMKPTQVYTEIVEKHPDSELAPLAQLKLAMWRLWNRDYRGALKAAEEFDKRFPKNQLKDRVDEVAMKAFDNAVENMRKEENYAGAVKLWNDSPMIRADSARLGPETRITLGMSFWKSGDAGKAVDLIDPFFRRAGMPKYSEEALTLALNVYLQNQAWDRIADLAERVERWELSPRIQTEFDYILALAYVNLDESGKSRPLFERLSQNKDLDPSRRAYTQYFMALEAREQGDMKLAYDNARASLRFFLDEKSPDDPTKPRDPVKVKGLLSLLVDVTESAGRTKEALRWALKYSDYVEKSDADWPAMRYRLAQLYKKTADSKNWRLVLEELQKDMPQSLYGRMAASELKTTVLEQNARQYLPSDRM